VTLRRTDSIAGGIGGSTPVTLTVLLTVNGADDKPVSRVHLRPSLTDAAYRPPHRSDGNRFMWQNVTAGNWFLVAEVPGVHAAFVTEVAVTYGAELRFDIQTAHLRVHAQREPGSPDPSEGPALYRMRLRPRGAGLLERVYNGDITGRQSAHVDFFVPVGSYEVRVDAPDTASVLVAEPTSQMLNVTAGGEHSLAFTLRAGASLRFRCTTASGAPFPHPEFLVTTHPAGSVPESLKSSVRKGGPDGLCTLDAAPYGPIYLHIWTHSSDWNNPDRVFELNLPAFKATDLGNVIAAP
jgi:hypothetical protein